MSAISAKRQINAFIFLALALNAALWFASRHIYPKWESVPPVPSLGGAMIMTLGDASLSYRIGALTLQSLGDGGGQSAPLKDYDYPALGKWFYLLDQLDPASNHVPMVAAYYFGGTPVPKDLGVIVDYLGTVGKNPAGNKWRWLAQSVYLARYRMHDLPLALDLAYKLSHMEPVGDRLPIWAQQMPAYILKEQGDKEAARAIAEGVLLSGEKLHQAEVNYLKGYIVETLGVPAEEVDKILQQRPSDSTTEEVVKTLPAPMPEQ
jgi:hypothetical protein